MHSQAMTINDPTHRVPQPQPMDQVTLHVGAPSCQMMNVIPMAPTAIHEPGRAQEVLQNAQNEQLDLNTPDLPSTERESEDRNQETVAEQPTEIPRKFQ